MSVRTRNRVAFFSALGLGLALFISFVVDASGPIHSVPGIRIGAAGATGPTGPTGSAGSAGAAGATGPTGPNWTTSAQLASSITDEVGTGFVCMNDSPNFTTLVTMGTNSASSPTGATIRGGDAAGGTANVNGGTLVLSGGKATGNGTSRVQISVGVTGTSGGTGAITPSVILDVNTPTGGGLANNSGVAVDAAGLWRMRDLFVPQAGATFGSGLNMNANSISGVATFQYYSTQTATAHAGGGQASAVQVCNSRGVSEITTVATTGDSVMIAVADGATCKIHNSGANAANVFPNSGKQICISGSCLSTDTATSLAAGGDLDCWSNTTKWFCR